MLAALVELRRCPAWLCILVTWYECSRIDRYYAKREYWTRWKAAYYHMMATRPKPKPLTGEDIYAREKRLLEERLAAKGYTGPF